LLPAVATRRPCRNVRTAARRPPSRPCRASLFRQSVRRPSLECRAASTACAGPSGGRSLSAPRLAQVTLVASASRRAGSRDSSCPLPETQHRETAPTPTLAPRRPIHVDIPLTANPALGIDSPLPDGHGSVGPRRGRPPSKDRPAERRP
jgi:hypothetical protein